jgi:alpha-beta hydrolase superfamily lysophospholipase
VLLLWGEADEIIPPTLASKWHAALSNCELVWVAKAGHSPHLEQASFVSQQIIDFLSDMRAPAASLTTDAAVMKPDILASAVAQA